ncbi:MAG: hypothetical protein V1847_03210, partial [Candidatus Diapherotrites archaeon]
MERQTGKQKRLFLANKEANLVSRKVYILMNGLGSMQVRWIVLLAVAILFLFGCTSSPATLRELPDEAIASYLTDSYDMRGLLQSHILELQSGDSVFPSSLAMRVGNIAKEQICLANVNSADLVGSGSANGLNFTGNTAKTFTVRTLCDAGNKLPADFQALETANSGASAWANNCPLTWKETCLT